MNQSQLLSRVRSNDLSYVNLEYGMCIFCPFILACVFIDPYETVGLHTFYAAKYVYFEIRTVVTKKGRRPPVIPEPGRRDLRHPTNGIR